MTDTDDLMWFHHEKPILMPGDEGWSGRHYQAGETFRIVGRAGPGTSRDEVLRLVREDMNRSVAECQRVLNESIYRSSVPSVPVAPPTFRVKLYRKWLRVAGYFSTLWQALCGADLVEYSDRDYY